MLWQGSINFEKAITLNGKPHGVVYYLTTPEFANVNQGQVIYVEDIDKLYYRGVSSYIELTPGSTTHNHDDRYYTETEIDAKFSVGSGHHHDGIDSKKVVYSDLDSIPTSFLASMHGNERHNATYLTKDNITYTLLDGNSLVGTGSSQIANGSHNHDSVYTKKTDLVASTGASLVGVNILSQSTLDKALTAIVTKFNDYRLASESYTISQIDSNYYTKANIDSNFYTKSNVYTKDDVYTKTELLTPLAAIIDWKNISNTPSTYPATEHNHNDIYYTKTNLQTKGLSEVNWGNLTSVPITLTDDIDYLINNQISPSDETSENGFSVIYDNFIAGIIYNKTDDLFKIIRTTITGANSDVYTSTYDVLAGRADTMTNNSLTVWNSSTGKFESSSITVSGSVIDGKIDWSNINSKPTTASGYGITDVQWSVVKSTPTTLAGYGITNASLSTHTHADLTNATSDNTASTLVKRDSNGGFKVENIVTTQFTVNDTGLNIGGSYNGTSNTPDDQSISFYRGSSETVSIYFDETNDIFKMGPFSNLKPVALRADTMTSNAIPYWDSTNKYFASSSIVTTSIPTTINVGSTPYTTSTNSITLPAYPKTLAEVGGFTPAYAMIYGNSLAGIMSGSNLILNNTGLINGATHDTATGSLTVSNTGIYKISVSGSSIVTTGGTTSSIQIEVRRNSESSVLSNCEFIATNSTTIRLAINIEGLVSLNSGDVLHLYQVNGSSTGIDFINVNFVINRIA